MEEAGCVPLTVVDCGVDEALTVVGLAGVWLETGRAGMAAPAAAVVCPDIGTGGVMGCALAFIPELIRSASAFGRYGWRLRNARMNGSNSPASQISLTPDAARAS